MGLEWTVVCSDHDFVSNLEFATVENNVNRLTHAHFIAHLKHGSFCCAECVRQSIFEESLCETNGDCQQVLEAFAILCGHWHQGDILTEVANLVVPFNVESMF